MTSKYCGGGDDCTGHPCMNIQLHMFPLALSTLRYSKCEHACPKYVFICNCMYMYVGAAPGYFERRGAKV